MYTLLRVPISGAMKEAHKVRTSIILKREVRFTPAMVIFNTKHTSCSVCKDLSRTNAA